MNAQFKKGIIELCVLKVISRKDMYGFEVIETLANEIEVNENTVYPILRRLTKQGYFDTYSQTVSVGAPRKYYRLNQNGIEQLRLFELEWMDFLSSVTQILGGHPHE